MTDFHYSPLSQSFERFIGTTDGQVERVIGDRTEQFFMSLLSLYGIALDWPGVEIKNRTIGRSITDEEPTDDKLSTLLAHDETLGIVYDRRTEFNHHEVTFFCREPSQELISWRDGLLAYLGSGIDKS
jgi:hypothetical protein